MHYLIDQDKHDLGSDSRADLCHNSAWEEVARGAAHARHHHLDVGEVRPGGDPGTHLEEDEEGHQGVGHGAEGDVGGAGVGLDGGQRSVREAAHQELHQPQGVDGGLSVGYDLAAKFVFTSLFS